MSGIREGPQNFARTRRPSQEKYHLMPKEHGMRFLEVQKIIISTTTDLHVGDRYRQHRINVFRRDLGIKKSQRMTGPKTKTTVRACLIFAVVALTKLPLTDAFLPSLTPISPPIYDDQGSTLHATKEERKSAKPIDPQFWPDRYPAKELPDFYLLNST